MEKIAITADGVHNLVDIEELHDFQGNLKDLSSENYDKLKKLILKHGMSFAVHVWDKDGMLNIVDGHQRLRVLRKMREEGIEIPPIPIVKVRAKDFKEARELVLAGTSQFGELTDQGLYEFIAESGLDWRDVTYDFRFPELDFNNFAADFYGDLSGGRDQGDDKKYNQPTGISLVDKFLVPPFSILDARQGYWQERKKTWIEEIGEMGESRQDTLGFTKAMSIKNNVSILDPVMAEALVKWFTPGAGSKCFDPFAGDTVFGYVAKKSGHNFTGIELRSEQARLNQERCDHVTDSGGSAKYHCDTSENIDQYLPDESQDFMFSCPPYFDLEVYSDDPKDLSTMETYAEFQQMISAILKKAVGKLKPDSFACIVIGEVRHKKTGFYHGLVPDMIRAVESGGAGFYNEIILATAIGNAGLRAGRYMQARKVAKIHQNVLIFYKGDPRSISKKFPIITIPDELTKGGENEETLSGDDSGSDLDPAE
jgi:hypothetical protein